MKLGSPYSVWLNRSSSAMSEYAHRPRHLAVVAGGFAHEHHRHAGALLGSLRDLHPGRAAAGHLSLAQDGAH